MTKRILCIIAAIAMVLSLAGCTAKTKTNTAYTGTVTTGAGKTAATISLSMNFQGFGGQMPNSLN